MARYVNPIDDLRYECRGAFHSTHNGRSRFTYDPRCESCIIAHGGTVNLDNTEEVGAWLER